ncbi:MAG: ion transporter [Methanosarcinales archaeon]
MQFFILFKKDKGKRKINATFFWHWIVFLAALVAVITLALEFLYELTYKQEHIIEIMDIFIIIIFAIDLYKEYRRYKGSKISFMKQHWLDILAIIPLFRIIRIAKLAKIEELGKLEKIVEIKKGIEVEEVASKTIHSRHLKDKSKK